VLSGIKAAAVVLDGQSDRLALFDDRDAGVRGVAVLDGVGQGLLQDPILRRFELGRMTLGLATCS
jgi:hypothetical protein